MLSPRAWFWAAIVGAVLLVLGGALGWAVFPYVVNIVIGQELSLKRDTEAWQRFVELPIDLDFKISIFNVTNVDEIMKGAKPRLKEVGPYVYKQHRKKYDIQFNDEDDTVSYHQNLIHHFDEENSMPYKSDDVVTVINPALMAMLGIMENIPVLSKGTMFVDAAQPMLFPGGLFVTTTADELLFRGVRIPCSKAEHPNPVDALGGHRGQGNRSLLDEALSRAGTATNTLAPSKRLAALITCSSLKRIKVPSVKVDDNGDVLFALFMNKNNTYDGLYTVDTGVRQPEKLAQIKAWEGKSYVTAWGGPTCNAINGTQGDIFSPYLSRDSTISVFSTDICRSMSLQYVEDTTFRGISGYRFAPGQELMASAQENGNNYCFCPQVAKGLTKENACLRKGALDLSGCQGLPVIATYPHFYESDPSYLAGVEGLNPKTELHRMQVDVEPMTGTPLVGGKKMQLNLEMKEIDGVNVTKGVRQTLFPVVWLYEGTQLNTELVDLLNNLLFSKLTILDAMKYTMLALGGVLLLSGSAMFLRARRLGDNTVRPARPGPVLGDAESARSHRQSNPGVAKQGAGGGDVGLILTRHGVSSSTATETKPQQTGSNGV